MAALSEHTRLADRRSVVTGDHFYEVGAADARYPATGWHIRGELGGFWTPPIKLLDGLWFAVDVTATLTGHALQIDVTAVNLLELGADGPVELQQAVQRSLSGRPVGIRVCARSTPMANDSGKGMKHVSRQTVAAPGYLPAEASTWQHSARRSPSC